MSDFYTNVDQVFSTWNYNHPRILHAFARSLKPAVLVDCGTYRGLSAAWMAKACQENNFGKVVSIDNWSLTEHSHILEGKTPKEHCIENLEKLGVREWVEFHDGETSNEALWPETVDFVYIDSFHSYNEALLNYQTAFWKGATLIAFDDTENCVGPRMLMEELRSLGAADVFDILDLHSDNGLTIFLKKQPRRPITFSQELPFPNPGVDLRPLTLEQQREHFDEAAKLTGLDYSSLYNQTVHDMEV